MEQAIRLAFDSLKIQGNTPTSIVFLPNTASTSSAPNMLDPNNGLQIPKVNPKAIKDSPSATQGYWVYNKNNFKPGMYIGKIVGARDPYQTVFISGIKQNICSKINESLHNYPRPYVSESYTDINIITAGATPTNPNTNSGIDFSLDTSEDAARWTAGCVKFGTASDDNFYFHLLDIH